MRCDRRASLRALAVAVLAAQSIGHAQPAKVYRIGFLSLKAGPSAIDEAFIAELRNLGYTVGRNLTIEYRWADGDATRLQPMADELVRMKVDIIVASATPAIRAAMRATSTIPIVMATSPDPVGTGVVANLSHPGGNVTGVSIQSSDLAAKRVQVLREIVSGLTRIAFILQGPRTPTPQIQAADLLMAEASAAGQKIGAEVKRYMIFEGAELAAIFAAIRRDGCQAVMVQIGPLTYDIREAIVAMAARERLAAIYDARDFVDVGGLVSYGPNAQERYGRAAWYVDRILKGARPGDLAVEQPAKLELVVNLKTAKALGLAIPSSLLLRADAVIQ